MLNQTEILALHGFTGCGEDFAKFKPFCSKLGGWVHPDLPGHGQAGALPCHARAMLRWIDSQARTLKPQTTKFLLGYSMGARAALLHAVARPSLWQGLILLSASPGIENPTERKIRKERDEILAQKLETEGLPAFLDFWQAQDLIRSQSAIRPEWRAAMRKNRESQQASGLARSLREFGQGVFPNLWPTLTKIQCPVLLLTGGNDHRYTQIAGRMVSILPHCSHHIIPACGHMPHLEQPEVTAEAILQLAQSLNLGLFSQPSSA